MGNQAPRHSTSCTVQPHESPRSGLGFPMSLGAPRAQEGPTSGMGHLPGPGARQEGPAGSGCMGGRGLGVHPSTDQPPWPRGDHPACPVTSLCGHPDRGWWPCVQSPTRPLDTREKGPGPGAHLSFRFSMKSSMVTWSKSTKSGLPHWGPSSSSILPVGRPRPGGPTDLRVLRAEGAGPALCPQPLLLLPSEP